MGERVGQNVRQLRAEREMTLAGLSERLEAGGHPLRLNALSRLERGERGVDVDDLVAIAAAFEVPVDRLLVDPAQAHERMLASRLERWDFERRKAVGGIGAHLADLRAACYQMRVAILDSAEGDDEGAFALARKLADEKLGPEVADPWDEEAAVIDALAAVVERLAEPVEWLTNVRGDRYATIEFPGIEVVLRVEH